MHSDCIAEALGLGMIVPVFVGVTEWEVLSRRVVEQGRSLLESNSWSEGKRCAGRRVLRRQMDLGGLVELVRMAVRGRETWMHTRDLRATVSLWFVSGWNQLRLHLQH
jgi:hypothetical protein